MSIEVIKKVTETEKIAKKSKLDAAANAKKMLNDAERAGRALLMEAREKAEAQVKIFLTDAEAAAAKNEQAILTEAASTCDALRRTAAERLPAAAELIVGRVVNV